MATIASAAGSITALCNMDYDKALIFATSCARDLGVETGKSGWRTPGGETPPGEST
ncbi:hypothetical protein I6A60_37815 [Frankia sp. AgB1.9]|uniref:hypothetical protein n=1 Tax=unclassified Frankia TaxID=2632575 RepID=UPI0019342D3E|nr:MULTISPECIES: hypothetical protein [unclassified Frankia]MBL7492905.1 hypothetical protein [Frankia sp. AgW1.1]MBL7553555.1 hypothetical protein [Frankia sp. AgB1.9]MBL7618214.1 hypothetical protein [Frankia sp. AgB1.8]